VRAHNVNVAIDALGGHRLHEREKLF
jgi:hypothetical protein